MLVKICGITNFEDAQAAAKAGADYLGFIINYPHSPRSINYLDAGNIIFNIRQKYKDIKAVGVFVDQSEKFVRKIGYECQLDVLQFHGQESPEYCQKFIKEFMVWKTIIIKSENDLKLIKKYLPAEASAKEGKNKVDKILLDSGQGSGRTIDLELLKKAGKIDVLAGGIGLGNIKKIIKLKPGIIDVNSKIELKPGKKDIKKLKKIISIIKT